MTESKSPSYRTLVALLIEARDALNNVPPVGENYDQQHSDTQLRCVQRIESVLFDIDTRQMELQNGRLT